MICFSVLIYWVIFSWIDEHLDLFFEKYFGTWVFWEVFIYFLYIFPSFFQVIFISEGKGSGFFVFSF